MFARLAGAVQSVAANVGTAVTGSQADAHTGDAAAAATTAAATDESGAGDGGASGDPTGTSDAGDAAAAHRQSRSASAAQRADALKATARQGAGSVVSFFKKVGDAAGNALAAANLDRLQEAHGEGGSGGGLSESSVAAVRARRRSSLALPTKFDALDITYVHPRVIAMAFPVFKAGDGHAGDAPTKIQRGNSGKLAAQFLREVHGGHFMVWNLSEETYDYSLFGDQVMEFRFPGHPAPPLAMLFKLCTAMQSWLAADPKNVAVVHCMTGRGRTAVVAACYMAWLGAFSSPMEALNEVCVRRGSSLERLTVPSQRRYASYFTYMVDGVKPRSAPLVLRRIIINGIPDMSGGARAGAKDVAGSDGAGHAVRVGARPYVQLFRSGKLLYSSTWKKATAPTGDTGSGESAGAGGGSGDTTVGATAATSAAAAAAGAPRRGSTDDDSQGGVRWYHPSDGSVRFSVDTPVHGDILLRCRHMPENRKPVSMFRAAFHTGYVLEHVLRFGRAQLDGASADDRFPDDCFVELIFAPVEMSAPVAGDAVAAPGAATGRAVAGMAAAPTTGAGGGASVDGAASGTMEGAVSVSADDKAAFDDMVSSTSAFWEEVARRREEREKRLAREAAEAKKDAEARAKEQAAAAARREARGDASDDSADGGDAGAGAGDSGGRGSSAGARAVRGKKGAKRFDLIDEDDPDDSVLARRPVAARPPRPPHVTSAAAAGPHSPTVAEADAELLALEKELGLDSLTADLAHLDVGAGDISGGEGGSSGGGGGGGGASTGVAGVAGAAGDTSRGGAAGASGGDASASSGGEGGGSGAALDDDAEIAELESYLEGLEGTSGS